MTLLCGTHSGGFHADDVLAFALVREFVDRDAVILRTRDLAKLALCDVVFDVGGEFAPERLRFDHHQAEYTGSRSSAGMVLDWLIAAQRVSPELGKRLFDGLVDHVDAVDNGRRTPSRDVPCFTSLVGCIQDNAADDSMLDDCYRDAANFAQRIVGGIRAGFERAARARAIVVAEMERAAAQSRRILFFDEYLPWKGAYFENGGQHHPSDFVLLPVDGNWRIVAIPPEPGSFAQKVPLPETWAGLVDDELARVTGVTGAKFCHKNRFVAVFATRDGALDALRGAGLA
jgi:uncharacterized UPF0160 family protein